MATIEGDKKLNRALQQMGRKSGTIAVAGIRAGLTQIAKAIKTEVPPRVRTAISSRMKKRKGSSEYVGKAGGGVGKRNKVRARGKRRGVGISKANVHWYLLGTTTRRQKTTGRVVGKMPPNDAVARGVRKSASAVRSAMQRKMWDRIQKETAKARRS